MNLGFILAIVIDKEVAKINTSFLVTYIIDTWTYNHFLIIILIGYLT